MADIRRLPGPNADLWDWQLRGSCRGADSSLFFHPEGERGPARAAREAAAKAVCMRCPVLDPCLQHALGTREPYGVWGGMSESEREQALASQPGPTAPTGAGVSYVVGAVPSSRVLASGIPRTTDDPGR